MKHLCALLAAALLATPALAGDLELDLGVGLRQTHNLGYEERSTGDPMGWASAAYKVGSFRLYAELRYVNTRKFFLPAGDDDHATQNSWAALYEPGTCGFGAGVGGHHTSLYTSQWDKFAYGNDLYLTWRFCGQYRGRVELVGHRQDNDEIGGATLRWSIRQPDRAWVSGYGIYVSAWDLGDRIEGDDQFSFGLLLRVVSR